MLRITTALLTFAFYRIKSAEWNPSYSNNYSARKFNFFKKIGTSGILGWKVKCLVYDCCMLLLCVMNGQTYVEEKVDLFLKLPLQWTWAWCMQPCFGSYVTLVNVHYIVASFLPIYLHLNQKCLFYLRCRHNRYVWYCNRSNPISSCI